MKTPWPLPLLCAALLTLAASTAQADVTVTPAAGESFRVNGPVVLPAVPGAGQQAQALCIGAGGQLGPCAASPGGGVTAGTGVSVNNGVVSIAPGYQLPQSCTGSQAIQWSGSAWVCVSPVSTGNLPVCSKGEVLRFGDAGLECGATPHLTTDITHGSFYAREVSAALGSDGLPVISAYAYNSSGTGRLLVRKCLVSSCFTTTGYYLYHTADVGRRSSIAVPPDGLPLIAYRNATDNSMEVVRCMTQLCDNFLPVQTLESNVGDGYTAIAIGADGLPRITYYDGVAARLRFARCTTADCSAKVIATVASGPAVGFFHSMALPADGLPIISYSDAPTGDLKTAKCNNANCTAPTLTTLDSAGAVGAYNSIAIGRDGLPVIAYRDSNHASLKVAHCNDQVCSSATLTTVDTDTNTALYPSIFIGANGPVISYNRQYSLKVANCHNDACTSATLNTLGVRSDDTTALLIGPDGLPVVAYHDPGTEGYRIIQCSSATCRQP